MEETFKKTAETFEEASRKLDHIKANAFAVQTKLALSSSLRDHLLNSEEVQNGCNSDSSMASKRGALLDEIRLFQHTLISHFTGEFPVWNESDLNFDYQKAKRRLIDMLESELADNANWKSKSPEQASLVEYLDYYSEALSTVLDKCKGDKYTILLVGEFQAGKTTTLDALCGGRHIGAIGTGTVTSAIPLSVSYSEKNHIQVRWKEKTDLMYPFSRLAGFIKPEVISDFDLDNADERKKLLGEIEELRRDSRTAGLITEEDAKYIALCSLVLSHWGSDEIQNFKTMQVPMDEVQPLTKFPVDMNSRWRKDGYKAFTFKESLFIFIKQIDCYCNSELLRELNGTIVDCPGLFANSYDTFITEQQMQKADAIWYIYPRERQGGQVSDEFLTIFKSKYPEYSRKLFVANNLSFANENNSRSIFGANQNDVLSKFGEGKMLIPYDAYMAYLGYMKISYDRGELSAKSISDFINSDEGSQIDHQTQTDEKKEQNSRENVLNGIFSRFKAANDKRSAEEENFDNVWQRKISIYNSLLGQAVSAENAVDCSNIRTVAAQLKSFIEANKAYSIIITEGANKLQTELKSMYEQLYRKFIEPYIKGRDGLKDLWNKRIERAQQFKNETAGVVHSALFGASQGKASLEERMSDVVYSKLFPEKVFEEIANDICDRLYSEIGRIKKLYKKDKEKLKSFLTKLVTESITDRIFTRVSYWNGLVNSQECADVTNEFLVDINAMETKLSLKWSEIFCDDSKFLMSDCYKIDKDTSFMKLIGSRKGANVNVSKGKVNMVIALDYAAIATAIAGAVAGYVLFLMVCATSGPLGWAIAAIAICIGGLWAGFKIEDFNKKLFRKKMLPELKKQLNSGTLKSSIKDMIRNEIHGMFIEYEKAAEVDIDRIVHEKDISISRLDDPEIEQKCFWAVGASAKVLEKNEKFNSFKKSLVYDEKN